MEIFFDAQMASLEPPAFILTLEPEAMSLQCIADMTSLSVQAYMRRNPDFWNKSSYQNFRPVLTDFHGILYGSSMFLGNQGIGASLAPSDSSPLAFLNSNSQLINLSFHCSRSYLQYIEEQRASNPSSNLILGFYFWAIMNLVPTTDPAPVYPLGSILIHSRQGDQIRISRSHWADMLLAIEHSQLKSQGGSDTLHEAIQTLLSLLSDREATHQEGSDALQAAIKHVMEANILFAQERYREAVQRCRQARDVLLGEDKKTWAATFLRPLIGTEKADMIDKSVLALKDMGDQASHGAGIEIERDVARYVISSMTLILDYIGRKIR